VIINGAWVGWGLGDWSHNPDGTDRDPTVRNAKKFMRAMYKSYAGRLADTNKYDQQMQDTVVEMQRRLVNDGLLHVGGFINGVLDLPTQISMGFKKPPPAILPIIFTVEGHMSDMFFGPAAQNAETLQNQGVCHWKPVWYDCQSLPFKNGSGVDSLFGMLNSQAIEGPPIDPNFPDGPKVMWPFHADVPFGIVGFSQGSMVISEFMEKHVLPPNGALHWRLPSFKRGLALGNPRREKGQICPWAVNPPDPDSSGIMDHDFKTTGTAIESRWEENAHKGDMFADNKDDKAGQDKTAVAKIITENSWIGGQAAIFSRVLALMGNPTGEALSAVMAIIQAVMFAVKNPNPHYSTVTEPGDVEWMRGVKNG
jgi:hypothetical protein